MRRVRATSLCPGLKRALQGAQKQQSSTFPSSLLVANLARSPAHRSIRCVVFGRTSSPLHHDHKIRSIRCFASMSGNGDDSHGRSGGMSGNFQSPFLGPCFSRLDVKRTSRGYEIEVFMSRQQHRSFSSEGKDSKAETSEIPTNNKAERMERRRRLTVLYPYNDQDILRKQRKRKEKALERKLASVNRAMMGNDVIAGAKFVAWISSQSSAMLSEFVHSVVDCANQYLLLQGLKESSNDADRKHPYGYGKSVYFWALVSALGTFFMGFGVSGVHAWGEMMNPSLHDIGPEVLGVLGFSFLVDGYVLQKTFKEIRSELPPGKKLWDHLQSMRDPATLAILLEDGAACFGVVLALAGTTLAHTTGNAFYDGLAGCSISVLLGTMGVILARVNYRFLLGQSVDKEITDNIEKILKSRRSIDHVTSVQSQWTGADTFSYKAEVGFDGTFLAAKLMPTHEKEFFAIRDTMKKDLPLVLSWYAEDVIRAVEQEVRIIEAQIRKKYPAAEFIELEPMSKDSHEFAIDGQFEKELRKLESENLENLRKLMPSLDPALGEIKASGAPLSPDPTETGNEKGPTSTNSQ